MQKSIKVVLWIWLFKEKTFVEEEIDIKVFTVTIFNNIYFEVMKL